MLIIPLLTACISRQEEGLVFKKTGKVRCELIDDAIFIGQPLSMQVVGDNLYITDVRSPMLIHYDLVARKELGRFITEGKGPNESLRGLFAYKDLSNDKQLYCFSYRDYRMYLLQYGDSLTFRPIFTLNYFYQKVFAIDNAHFLAVGSRFRTGERYRVLNAKGEVLESFGEMPAFAEGEEAIPYDSRALFHQVKFEKAYGVNKVAVLSNYVLDIIDISPMSQDSISKRVLLAPYDYNYTSGNVFYVERKDGYIAGARDLACDHKYIYALVNPKVTGQSEAKPLEIWIFNWDGEPVRKSVLDRDIELITSSNKEGLLYGLALVDDEDYHIVSISL